MSQQATTIDPAFTDTRMVMPRANAGLMTERSIRHREIFMVTPSRRVAIKTSHGYENTQVVGETEEISNRFSDNQSSNECIKSKWGRFFEVAEMLFVP
jgi:hypothetical protein